MIRLLRTRADRDLLTGAGRNRGVRPVRVRPVEDVDGAQRRLRPDRLHPPRQHACFVRADRVGRTEEEHDRRRRVESVAPAEFLSCRARLQLEEPVPMRCTGDDDRRRIEAVELDRLSTLSLVPDERSIGRNVDPPLVRKVVPAAGKESCRYAERACGLHHLRLVAALLDEWADEHDVRTLGADQLHDLGVRRNATFELGEGRFHQSLLFARQGDERIGPRLVGPPTASGCRLDQVLQRSLTVERCQPMRRGQVPRVAASIAKQRDRASVLGLGDLVVDDELDSVAPQRLRELFRPIRRRGDHDLMPVVGKLIDDVHEAGEGPVPGKEQDANVRGLPGDAHVVLAPGLARPGDCESGCGRKVALVVVPVDLEPGRFLRRWADVGVVREDPRL